MTVPAAPTSTAIALPNSTALTGKMLDDLTKVLGVARSTLPSDQQIAHAWTNLLVSSKKYRLNTAMRPWSECAWQFQPAYSTAQLITHGMPRWLNFAQKFDGLV
jgi:hypothetical protein